jgi:hypothetical protein
VGFHHYPTGKGTLNLTNPCHGPTVDADGNTLAKASVGGRPLVPGPGDSKLAAAVAIQNGALVAVGKKIDGIEKATNFMKVAL